MAIITGFEPFGGRTENASWRVAERVAGTFAEEGFDIQAKQVPVEFDAIGPFLAHHRRETIISIGEAAVADRARLEIAGRLWQHGTDNTGKYFNRPLASILLSRTHESLVARVQANTTGSETSLPQRETNDGARRRSGVRVLYDGPRPPAAVIGENGLEYAVRAPENVVSLARKAGLAISSDAGLYICNTTTALGYAFLNTFAFLHVPAVEPSEKTLTAVSAFVRSLLVHAHGGDHEVQD